MGVGFRGFPLMGLERIQPSSLTLVSVALACSNLNKHDRIRLGKDIQGYILRVVDGKTFTNNSLMAIYTKLGRIYDAKIVFQCFAHCNMVSWNTVIGSFSQNDRFHEALKYFSFMKDGGFKPDGVTISSVLPACSHLELLDLGKQIHAYVFRNDDFIWNSFARVQTSRARAEPGDFSRLELKLELVEPYFESSSLAQITARLELEPSAAREPFFFFAAGFLLTL